MKNLTSDNVLLKEHTDQQIVDFYSIHTIVRKKNNQQPQQPQQPQHSQQPQQPQQPQHSQQSRKPYQIKKLEQHYSRYPMNSHYYVPDEHCLNQNHCSTDEEEWAARVLHNINGFLYVLSPEGIILYCSDSSLPLIGYHPHEVVGQQFTELLHPEDISLFEQNFQYAFKTPSRVKIYFRIKCKNSNSNSNSNSFLLLECFGQTTCLTQTSTVSFLGIAQPCFFNNDGLLDSFLELQIENDRLKSDLTQLLSVQPPFYQSSISSSPSIESSSHFLSGSSVNSPTQFNSWNYNASTSPKKDYSASDCSNYNNKMKSTTSGHFFVDDVAHRNKWKRKKKEHKVKDYVCTDCGVTSTPEWRKGPYGSKTLCNACGLRWAKRIKKSLQSSV